MAEQHVDSNSALTKRRGRVADPDTSDRMLATAVALINDAGLTVSLDHLSYEQIIEKSGVSRTTAYRRWPYKGDFFGDVLRELAKGTGPAVTGSDRTSVAMADDVLREKYIWLRDPDLRIALAGEVLRRTALAEFDAFRTSAEWATYSALQATFLSLPPNDLRADVEASLRATEDGLVNRIAATYEAFAKRIGLRVRTDTDANFHSIATLASATVRGLILMSPTNPEIDSRRFLANPFGAPEAAEWTMPALGLATMVLSFLETDPDVHWGDHAIEKLRKEIVARAADRN